MMKHFLKTFIISIVVAVIGMPAAYCQAKRDAQVNMDSLNLQELLNMKVSTVSKTSQSLEGAPASVIVITREQIKIRGYQSLLDVIYDLPDMKVDDKIYSQSRNRVTVRGTAGQDKFIIMLDGVRISSPTNEALPVMENYLVHFAEQIEVVYGPASALYGADAVSGVINIITQKPVAGKKMNVDVSSAAGMHGYTNNTLFLSTRLSQRAHLVVAGQYYYDKQPDYSKIYKDDSLYSPTPLQTGTFNTVFGPMTPETPVRPKYEMPMQAYNLYAALHIDGFSFTAFKNYTRLPNSWENNTNHAVYNKEVFSAQTVNVLNAAYKKSFGSITSTTSMTGSEYILLPESNYRNLYTEMEPGYKYAYGSMIKAEQQIDWKLNEKFEMVGGMVYENYHSIPQTADLDAPVDPGKQLEGTYLNTKHFYNPEGIEAKFYNIRYHNAGAYLQAQYSPGEKIDFTVGSRYDYNSRYGASINPRVSIVYRPFSKTIIKALYGSAFLAPAPSTNYIQYGSFETADSGKTYRSHFLHLPNPDLKPIKSNSIELSIKQYLAGNFSITLNGYYTHLTNLHEFADDNESTRSYNNTFQGIPVDYIEVFVNNAQQHNYGVTLHLNHKQRIGRIKMNNYAALSYTSGKIDNALREEDETGPDQELDVIASFLLHAGSDIKYGKFSLSTRLICMGRQHISGFTGEISKTGNLKRQTLPGYALLNFSIRYNVLKNLSVFANVTNALNQRYRSSGYDMDLNNTETVIFPGQPSDPIRVMGGINFTW